MNTKRHKLSERKRLKSLAEWEDGTVGHGKAKHTDYYAAL